MKHPLITALALAALLTVSSGATTVSAQGTQQERMRLCNSQASARHLMGGERRRFMSTCLSKRHKEPRAMNTQQRKMKDCNAGAKSRGLKGAARKRYMSECLRR